MTQSACSRVRGWEGEFVVCRESATNRSQGSGNRADVVRRGRGSASRI